LNDNMPTARMLKLESIDRLTCWPQDVVQEVASQP
jgi:hypothetical protein